MSKFKYTEFEQEMNTVLKHQDEELSSIHFPSKEQTDSVVGKAEELLRLLGKDPQNINSLPAIRKTPVVICLFIRSGSEPESKRSKPGLPTW